MKPKLPEIAGVTPSLFTNQLLVSTGVPDLDILLGGGIIIGSVLVISEDFSGNFSRLMLKYFLSEGVVHKHSLLVTNSSPDCKILTQNLPSFEFNTNSSASGGDTADNDEKMMIAWRYQGQNTTKDTNINISNVNNSEHTFNLLKTVPSEVLDRCDISVCDIESDSDDDQWIHSSYCKVIKQIQDKIKSGGFLIDPTEPGDHTNILRIGIQSLGLSLWGDLQHQQKHLPMFLYCLRSLLRSCFGVAVITIPATVLRNVKNILHFDTDDSKYSIKLHVLLIKFLVKYCIIFSSDNIILMLSYQFNYTI